jgi:5,5'-dehydrodivanillate O-demethylase
MLRSEPTGKRAPILHSSVKSLASFAAGKTNVLTAEQNTRLTGVGPGTPMGSLLRRYWMPIATAAEMRNSWTKRVRLMGEDLVLYRDRSSKYGLIGESCPHRKASLAYGIPESDGIRCPYHGWKFDQTGSCTDQPNEPDGSTFREKVRHPGYPVGELGGMLWGYLGPLPAPLIPRLDGFVAERAIRQVGEAVVPCNWLQIMENSVDPVHTEWLHGNLHEFRHEMNGTKVAISRHHVQIAFDEFEYGIVKRRLLEGQSEDSDDWTVGHPVVFPNILAVGSGGGLWQQYTFQIRVPVDDENTRHYWYNAYVPPSGAHVPQHLLDEVTLYEPPIVAADGSYLLDYIHGQDIMAWTTQGRIADRTTESLSSTDRGITMYRKMLEREMLVCEAGGDPKGVIRDALRNVRIDLPLERNKDMFMDGFESLFRRHMSIFSPVADEILDVFAQARKSRSEVLNEGSALDRTLRSDASAYV